MIDKRDFLERRLTQYYNWILRDKTQSVTTRNWCLTIWVASVAWVLSNNISLISWHSALIIYLPVLLFWMLDSFQNSFIDLNEQCAKQIEEILTLDNLDNVNLQKHLPIYNHDNTPFSDKIRAFISSLFFKETVSFVYLILLAASTVLIFFSQSI
jgi:hypothetical protein